MLMSWCTNEGFAIRRRGQGYRYLPALQKLYKSDYKIRFALLYREISLSAVFSVSAGKISRR